MSLSHLLKEKKRTLTDKQSNFLAILVSNGGDVTSAINDAGYYPTSRSNIVRSLREEIIEITRSQLVGSSIRAANRIVEGLDADGTLPSSQMDTRLKSAQDVLDRIGVSKRAEVEHTGEVTHGIILLPAKEPMKRIDSVQWGEGKITSNADKNDVDIQPVDIADTPSEDTASTKKRKAEI